MTVVLVAVLGGLGAASRFVVDGWIRARWNAPFPVATVLINVSGSLLLGLLAGGVLFGDLARSWLVVGGVGFCGGYTTFSTAMVETVRLVQAGESHRAALNAVGSLVLAVGAASLGVAVVWAVTGPR